MSHWNRPFPPCDVCDESLPENEMEPRFGYCTCLLHRKVPPAMLSEAKQEFQLSGKTRWDI